MASGSSLRRGYCISFALPIGAALAFHWHYPWLFVAFTVGLFPVLDAMIGRERTTDVAAASAACDAAIPAIFMVTWTLALVFASLSIPHAGLIEWIGLTLAAGLLSGMSMAHSHELMHRKDRSSRLVSELGFIIAGYPTYRTAHLLHHANLGNPLYGSTARVGQSVWAYVGRSAATAARASLRYEGKRSRSLIFNRFTRNLLASASLAIAAFLYGQWAEFFFYIGYSFVCIFVVEAIAYMQHYGLDELSDLKEEVVAWDVDYWLSNRMFANNGYHTHHHTDYTCSYCRLTHGHMTLPGGYIHMLLVALVPPLWFSLMNERVTHVRRPSKPA
jgi:alkane 1-monooxygenase